MREMYGFLRLATCEPTCESVWRPFAIPYASSEFANLRCLRRLPRPFGQGKYTPRLFETPDVLLRLVSKNAFQIIILVLRLSEKSLKNMEFRYVSPVKRLFDTPRTKNPNSEPPCNNFNYTVQPRCIQSVLPEM